MLLKVQLRDGISLSASSGSADAAPASLSNPDLPASLDAPGEIEVLTPAVWFPGTREVIWRIAAAGRRGSSSFSCRSGARPSRNRSTFQIRCVRRSPVRLEPAFVNQLLYPAEAPLPGEPPVTSISVAYPERDIPVFGLELHWMIVYFALSMIFAFALRKRFKRDPVESLRRSFREEVSLADAD